MTDIKDLELLIKSAESTLEILRGDLEAHKQQQQPEQESLFGRWATHKEYGRGIIVSRQPDGDGEVRFAYQDGGYTDGAETRFARPGSLTLDPATLTTVKDFNDAPEGTIAEIMVEPKGVYVKKDNVWFGAGEDYPTAVQSLAKARVIRWGNGQ